MAIYLIAILSVVACKITVDNIQLYQNGYGLANINITGVENKHDVGIAIRTLKGWSAINESNVKTTDNQLTYVIEPHQINPDKEYVFYTKENGVYKYSNQFKFNSTTNSYEIYNPVAEKWFAAKDYDTSGAFMSEEDDSDEDIKKKKSNGILSIPTPSFLISATACFLLLF